MRIFIGSLLAFALVACGGNGNGGTGGGSGGSAGSGTGGSGGSGGSTGGGTGGTGGGTVALTFATFCTGLADAQCSREQRCANLDAAQLSLCKAQAASGCSAALSFADAGAISFDPSAAATCLADVDSFPCTNGGTATPKSCAGTFAARGGVGAPCGTFNLGIAAVSDTCATGYCAFRQNTCNACTAFVANGQPCNHNLFGGALRCGPTTGFCPVDDGGARLCQPFAPSGTACVQFSLDDSPCGEGCFDRGDGGFRCGFLAMGAVCSDPVACGPNSYCRNLFRQTGVTNTVVRRGTCAPRINMGSGCVNEQEDDGCTVGGTCLDGQCKPLPFFSRNMGQECDAVGQCVDTAYCKDLYYNPPDGGARAGSCAPRVSAGAPCRQDPGSNEDPCAQGSICPLSFGGPLGNCTARGSIGAVCGGGANQCKTSLDCYKRDGGLGNTGFCRLPADAGQRCGGDTQASCRSESFPTYYCAADGGFGATGTCNAPLPVGSPCDSAGDCTSARCFVDGGTVRVCQPPCF